MLSLKSSTESLMRFTRKRASEISFSKRSTKPFKKAWRPRTLRSTSFWLLQESTHKHLVSSDLLWKKLKILRVMPLEKFKPPLRRSEKLTPIWSRPTKVNSPSLVFP
jgi:hypothetical protein